MIAAAALADDAPVATANRADFVRLTELGVSTAQLSGLAGAPGAKD